MTDALIRGCRGCRGCRGMTLLSRLSGVFVRAMCGRKVDPGAPPSESSFSSGYIRAEDLGQRLALV